MSYIDWNPFFAVWQLRGKYPNRGYPRIFEDAEVGAEAKRVFDDAQKMLKSICDGRKLQANGVVGFFPANSVGDDIEVYEDESRTVVKQTLHTLRQQEYREEQKEYLAMSDFIAPKGAGIKDYIGLFAVTCGLGMEKLIASYEAKNDDYGKIMAQALADRLAEAYGEKLHLDVRVKEWGYAPNEDMSEEDILKVKYDGIRPAPGYPSQPDHTEKQAMWDLLKANDLSSIELTESLAMLPAASVSGLYFANPESKYFAVGKIQKDQVGVRFDRYAAYYTISMPKEISTNREGQVIVSVPYSTGDGLCRAQEDGSLDHRALACTHAWLRHLRPAT